MEGGIERDGGRDRERDEREGEGGRRIERDGGRDRGIERGMEREG